MESCISCDQKRKLNQKTGNLYRTIDGISYPNYFVKFDCKVDECIFQRVRVDIGDQLGKKQKREFNAIYESYDRYKLLDLLGLKFKMR